MKIKGRDDRIKNALIIIFTGVGFLVIVAYQSQQDSKIGAMSVPSDPHEHVVDVNANNWLGGQNAADFQMKMVDDKAYGEQEHYVEAINSQASFLAFSGCTDKCRVFVADILENQVYELEAPSLTPSRPIINLVWATDDILVFDQWSQPHHGVHYAVNVSDQALLLAAPFPDWLFSE
jgi:hypothetical protein